MEVFRSHWGNLGPKHDLAFPLEADFCWAPCPLPNMGRPSGATAKRCPLTGGGEIGIPVCGDEEAGTDNGLTVDTQRFSLW